MTYDFLIVYNTCGIGRDSTNHYITCLKSILDSKSSYSFKVVVSSCLNKPQCRQSIKDAFGDKVEIVEIDKPYTVNITYNRTCQKMIEKYGKFRGYLYLDSGIDFCNNEEAIHLAFDSFVKNDYGILSMQASNDHGMQNSKGGVYPITGSDYIIPPGGSVNGHADIFSHAIFDRYGKLWPDVFVAFCTESTFSFVAASVGKRWAILRDVVLNHNKSVDGASIAVPHVSRVTGNSWNNLLAGRNAMDFITDPESIKYGLGYEECNNILMHNPSAYSKEGYALYPTELSNLIEKYYYLNNKELDYSGI